MASKRDWLEAGLRVLGEDGAPALTIERLCGDLGLTKGSFYHHFKGMAGFKTDLLRHFETEHTSRYIDSAEAVADAASVKLDHLVTLVLEDKGGSHDLEIAMRAWAAQDDEVHALQQRVDRLRIDYLTALCGGLVGRRADAGPLAHLLYLVLVGAQQVVPPLPAEDLREIYALALRLAPDNRGDDE
ncbi:TetR/AcrR family transcriptional regulator [Nonomuraea sp. NPDC003804]|uniref:TetR/AcrR family transcriptional regulator n=1 Tax=Nonomuraea sp. NPDC003804 TaxID=3154547 RepID=UPI0033A58D82